MRILLFFALFQIPFFVFSQGKDANLPKKGNQISMTINNRNIEVEIDEQGAEIVLTFKELEMMVKKQIVLYKPNMRKDTLLVNGKRQVNLSLNLDTLRFDCLVLTNVSAKIVYTIPNYDPKAKARIGLAFLKKYGKVQNTLQNLSIQNIADQNLDLRCKPVTVDMPEPCAYFTQIRFVLCSSDPAILQKKAIFQNKILNSKACQSYTEESNIPRQKAIDRVQSGITIRYFDEDDFEAVQKMEETLKNRMTGETVYLENMQTYFKNPMPKYIEIWIK